MIHQIWKRVQLGPIAVVVDIAKCQHAEVSISKKNHIQRAFAHFMVLDRNNDIIFFLAPALTIIVPRRRR